MFSLSVSTRPAFPVFTLYLLAWALCVLSLLSPVDSLPAFSTFNIFLAPNVLVPHFLLSHLPYIYIPFALCRVSFQFDQNMPVFLSFPVPSPTVTLPSLTHTISPQRNITLALPGGLELRCHGEDIPGEDSGNFVAHLFTAASGRGAVDPDLASPLQLCGA